MAKLKAHGTELLRIEKFETKTDYDNSIYQVRNIRVYMSDGVVLGKFYAQIKGFGGVGLEWHDYGWKRAGRYAKQPDAASRVQEIKSRAEQTGWKVHEKA